MQNQRFDASRGRHNRISFSGCEFLLGMKEDTPQTIVISAPPINSTSPKPDENQAAKSCRACNVVVDMWVIVGIR